MLQSFRLEEPQDNNARATGPPKRSGAKVEAPNPRSELRLSREGEFVEPAISEPPAVRCEPRSDHC